MKSKKKLLIAMAAMSVAAIGAGTVSTFAWYSATLGANIHVSNTATGSVGVTSAEYSVNDHEIDVLKISVDVTSSSPLEMAYYNAEATGTKNLGTGYVFQGVFYPLGVDGVNAKKMRNADVLYQTVTVTIGIKDEVQTADKVVDDQGVTWNMASILEQVNAKTYKVNAARTTRTVFTKVTSGSFDGGTTYYSAPGVEDDEVTAGNWSDKIAAGIYTAGSPVADGSMARFFNISSGATSDSENATNMDTVTGISLNLASKSATHQVTFGVYVFGGAHTGTNLEADTNAFLDGFSVVVSQA